MPWFLVDDQFPTDGRVLATSLAARGLWVTAGAWSSAHLTDVVPDHVVASLGSTPQLAAELVTAKVWKRARRGYQFIQEGTCRIPSPDAVENSRKSKAARQARWREKRRQGDAPVDGGVDAVDNSERKPGPQNPRSQDHGRRPVDASTRRLPGPDPDPVSGVDVITSVAGGNGRASPDVIDAITRTILEVTGRHITEEWAGRVAAEILGGHAVSSPAAYAAKAIRSDPNPKRRFLPLY